MLGLEGVLMANASEAGLRGAAAPAAARPEILRHVIERRLVAAALA